MSFTTATFALFLAGVFGLYWGLGRRRPQNLLLLLASYGFYGWWDWRFCGLMLGSSLVDYAAARALGRASRPGTRRSLLALSVAANLGVLGFFKYANFFMENLITAAAGVGVTLDPFTLRVILPVGISFYTFQTMSYTIDVYRRQTEPCRSLLDYLAYVSFFPQLVAGPIERAGRLLPQFRRRRVFDEARAADGCRLILWGLFKKMVVADSLAPLVDAAYHAPHAATGPQLAAATAAFALQIYCDFSGYSDIARGVARLLGFELMVNFRHPYFAQSVSEFWRRWHVSLSSWFRDYVYIPLGGSRAGPVRRSGNVMAVFLVSGLWHGESWNFVIWGGINGLAVLPAVWRGASAGGASRATAGGEGLLPSPGTLARMGVTFAVVCVAWVFFRAATLGDAAAILARIAGDALTLEAYRPLYWDLTGFRWRIAAAGVVVLVAAEWAQRRDDIPWTLPRATPPVRWACYTALFWATLIFGTRGDGGFIYFQF